MLYVFSKSSIGYSHIKDKGQCQDFSAVYKDPKRTIITCCDGHGGRKYIRSHIGSHMASNAIINVFNSIHPSFFRLKDEEIENKIMNTSPTITEVNTDLNSKTVDKPSISAPCSR